MDAQIYKCIYIFKMYIHKILSRMHELCTCVYYSLVYGIVIDIPTANNMKD